MQNQQNQMGKDVGSSSGVLATRVRNAIIALVAIVLGVALATGINTTSNTTSLATLAERSLPLVEARANGKPTLIEFYANWCTSCQAMAADMLALETAYADRVNFVMLNVDNTQWLPEMTQYDVDGIPHFVWLDGQGATVAEAIGEQPSTIMEGAIVALAAGEPIAFNQFDAAAQASQVEETVAGLQRSDDPRSHGATAGN